MWYGSEQEERTKNTSEIKFQFPWRSSVSLNLAGFYWKNVCLEYWPAPWHLTLTHTHGTMGQFSVYESSIDDKYWLDLSPIISYAGKYVPQGTHDIGPQQITSWLNFETVFNLYTSNFCRMEKSPENTGCNLHICKFSSLLVSVCPIVNNAQGDNTILHIFVNIPRTRSHGGPGSQPGAVWTVTGCRGRWGSKSCFYNQNFASVGVKIFEKLLN